MAVNFSVTDLAGVLAESGLSKEEISMRANLHMHHVDRLLDGGPAAPEVTMRIQKEINVYRMLNGKIPIRLKLNATPRAPMSAGPDRSSVNPG